jgi:hypothetical protein
MHDLWVDLTDMQRRKVHSMNEPFNSTSESQTGKNKTDQIKQMRNCKYEIRESEYIRPALLIIEELFLFSISSVTLWFKKCLLAFSFKCLDLIHEFQRIEIRGALHGRGIKNFQTGQITLVLCMIFGLT